MKPRTTCQRKAPGCANTCLAAGLRIRMPGSLGAPFKSVVSDVDGRGRASPLAQLELLDLAGRGLRQFAEHDRLGHLVAGQVLAAMGDDVLGRRRGAGLELDE